MNNNKTLKISRLDTKLGAMVAISDEDHLYFLEFADKPNLEHEIEQLKLKIGAVIVRGHSKPITLIESELKRYFEGTLTEFKTPFRLLGSPFQQLVWQKLSKIPYGQTRSYLEQAKLIGKPTAYRAVGNANSSNRLAVIIPCHRVINSNGDLGGYSGGYARKKWLIEHERR
jgi:O-6-methylguanine DNA methyltransferase